MEVHQVQVENYQIQYIKELSDIEVTGSWSS